MGKKIMVTRTSMPPYEEFIEAIKPLWETHWLTNMGPYHKQLEKEILEYLDVPEFSLMVNGHTALEMAIQAFGFTKESEVITTPFTFISTTHAIVRNGLKPVFCDVRMEDGTIDAEMIEGLITEKTVAILPVHVYGNICDVEAIDRISKKYALKVIYDASHAFGEKYNGIGVGNFGDASTFSFHATKVFNTIEGGGVSFSNSELYTKLYNLKNFGIRGEELVTEVGSNAKMNELAAIMGICNLKHLSEEISKRENVVKSYLKLLENNDNVRMLRNVENVVSNFGYFPIVCKDFEARESMYKKFKERNIYTRKYFYPISVDQACYKDEYVNANVPNARELSSRVLTLPLYADMSFDDVRRVVDGL